MATQTASEKLEINPLTIDWPKELKIKPLWEIDISKNYKAEVYTKKGHRDRRDAAGMMVGEEFDIWTLAIISKKTGYPYAGNAPVVNRHYTVPSGTDYHDLFDLRSAIVEWAKALAPKTKTVKVTDNEDD